MKQYNILDHNDIIKKGDKYVSEGWMSLTPVWINVTENMIGKKCMDLIIWRPN